MPLDEIGLKNPQIPSQLKPTHQQHHGFVLKFSTLDLDQINPDHMGYILVCYRYNKKQKFAVPTLVLIIHLIYIEGETREQRQTSLNYSLWCSAWVVMTMTGSKKSAPYASFRYFRCFGLQLLIPSLFYSLWYIKTRLKTL